MYKHNTEALLHNHCCSGKAILITYSDCVSVASHAMHMCHILLPVACLAVPYFPTLSHHATVLGRKLLNVKCVLIFSKTFLIIRTDRDIINVLRSSCKICDILVRF